LRNLSMVLSAGEKRRMNVFRDVAPNEEWDSTNLSIWGLWKARFLKMGCFPEQEEIDHCTTSVAVAVCTTLPAVAVIVTV
jgi:hypothetical protein